MTARVGRREFLRRGAGAGSGARELSCERLYMQSVDARREGRVAELREWLEAQLRGVDELRLLDSGWRAGGALGPEIESVLASFRARGGRIELA